MEQPLPSKLIKCTCLGSKIKGGENRKRVCKRERERREERERVLHMLQVRGTVCVCSNFVSVCEREKEKETRCNKRRSSFSEKAA